MTSPQSLGGRGRPRPPLPRAPTMPATDGTLAVTGGIWIAVCGAYCAPGQLGTACSPGRPLLACDLPPLRVLLVGRGANALQWRTWPFFEPVLACIFQCLTGVWAAWGVVPSACASAPPAASLAPWAPAPGTVVARNRPLPTPTMTLRPVPGVPHQPGGGGGADRNASKQQGGSAPPHICQVVRPPIAFDSDVGRDIPPFYFVPQSVGEFQDLFPQVNVFNQAGCVVPFVSAPSLGPPQHSIYQGDQGGVGGHSVIGKRWRVQARCACLGVRLSQSYSGSDRIPFVVPLRRPPPTRVVPGKQLDGLLPSVTPGSAVEGQTTAVGVR